MIRLFFQKDYTYCCLASWLTLNWSLKGGQGLFLIVCFCLAVSGLSCSVKDLSCGAWAPPVVARGLSRLTACGIFVPRVGIEPMSPTLEGRSLTAREVSGRQCFNSVNIFIQSPVALSIFSKLATWKQIDTSLIELVSCILGYQNTHGFSWAHISHSGNSPAKLPLLFTVLSVYRVFFPFQAYVKPSLGFSRKIYDLAG